MGLLLIKWALDQEESFTWSSVFFAFLIDEGSFIW